MRGGLVARAAHFLGVAGDVADGRIELRERDVQAVGGPGVHDVDLRVPACRRNASQQAQPLGERQQPDQRRPAAAIRPTAADPMSLMRPMAG